MRIVFVLIFWISCSVYSQEKEVRSVKEKEGLEVGVDIDQQDPNMDALYKKGPYLVYDCRTRHWVCTKELEYKRCQRQRKESLLDYDDKLPCATFDIFDKRQDCWKRQQELTDVGKYEQFCLHPSKVENRLIF